jgi:ABC-type lipoprotein export system ATPase subunit
MANQADLIIADEPTASLDTENGHQIIQILHDYAKNRGKCVVVASHDLRMLDFADRLFLMEDGLLCPRNAAIDHRIPMTLGVCAAEKFLAHKANASITEGSLMRKV